MNGSEFEQILLDTCRQLQELTHSKGKEYANSDDQLANFKRLGQSLSLNPQVVLHVYLAKHLDGIAHYVRSIQQGKTLQHSEPITGRIDDAILYLVLLKALIADEAISTEVSDAE